MPKRISLLLCTALLLGCQQQASSPAPTGSDGAKSQPPAAASQPESAPSTKPSPAKQQEPWEPELLPDELLAEGWISLFDGHTLFGWDTSANTATGVTDQMLVLAAGEPQALPTTFQVGDCVLRLEFQTPAGTEGSVLLSYLPTATDPAEDFFQVRLNHSEAGAPTGSLVGRQEANATAPSADWRSLSVRLEKGEVTVELDDRQVLQYTTPQPPGRGHIGLQCDRGTIRFRQLRLQPLGLDSLFNGEDLTGWKTYPEMDSVFSVTEEGYLNVKNGRGQLESERQFADFVLQLECITHAPGLNSGIFFRCIPGEQMNGYESQIHNGFENGDRTQPTDCGTGGIFRRQDARRVVADDQEWFYKTLIVNGPHMAAWVNGFQVSDWTDTRDPHPNPRNGLRLEKGTLMIQGHDPTTDLSFRNLRAAELPPRAER